MKHTQETKDKISATLKRKGIKPTVLPSKAQSLLNLAKAWASPNKGGRKVGSIPWNKGNKTPDDTNKKSGVAKKAGRKLGSIPWNKGLKGYKSGEDHYNWKGGAKTETLKIRTSTQYNEWRKSVYKRDWYACRLCESKIKIEAHHIKTVKEKPDLMLDIDNGITLCRDCHTKTRGKEWGFINMFTHLILFIPRKMRLGVT